MLFAVSFTPRANTNEDREKRTLNLFSQWKPPAGYEFKSFYDYADGDGGIAIVEAATAEALARSACPLGRHVRVPHQARSSMSRNRWRSCRRDTPGAIRFDKWRMLDNHVVTRVR